MILRIVKCVQIVNAIVLAVGLVTALIAAVFGDIALDAAIDKGFAKAPLERHEELATLTIVFFYVLTLLLVGAIWRKVKVQGIKATIFILAFYVGVGALLVTAYHGGNLVYKVGVNVEVIKPNKEADNRIQN